MAGTSASRSEKLKFFIIPERRGRPDDGCIAGIQELRGESVVYGLGRRVVNTKDTLNFNTGQNTNADSSQRYIFGDSHGEFYGCGIASEGNVSKFVSKGCNQTIKFK